MKKLGKNKGSATETSKKSDKVALKQPIADKAIDLIRAGNIEALMLMCADGSTELKFINRFHSKSGKTALSVACEDGALDMVDVLLQAKASVDIADQQGMTPFLYASLTGQLDIINLLYSVNPDVAKKQNLKGDNAIILATKNNHFPVVELLHSYKVPLEDRNAQDETALSVALKLQYFAIAEFLCAHGADINAAGINGNTPLIRSAFDGRVETADFIIAHAGSLDLINLNGETAAIVAARHNHRDILELLIKSGAQLSVQDHSQRNVLMTACMTGKYNLIDLLMDKSCLQAQSNTPTNLSIDIDAKDIWGNTALIYVCCQGDGKRAAEQYEAAEKLVRRYGAAIDSMDRVFNTALMHCCMKGHLELALLLLRLGASPHHRNIDGIAMRDLWVNEDDRRSFDDAVVGCSGHYMSVGVVEKPEWINHLNELRDARQATAAAVT